MEQIDNILNQSGWYDDRRLPEMDVSQETSFFSTFQRNKQEQKPQNTLKEQTQAKTLISKGKRVSKERNSSRKKKSRNMKKNKVFKYPDYRKNICGYVTKKTLRQFIGVSYEKCVRQMCDSHNVDYESLKNFYSTKIQRVTGPSHIPDLIISKKSEHLQMNSVFLKFFKWFLEERYVRHLYLEGKMELKKEYIEYKNRQLLPMLGEIERRMQTDTQISHTNLSHSHQM